MNWRNIVIFLVCLAMSFGLGWYLSHYQGRNGPIIDVKTETDTLIVRDTICVEKAVFITRRVVDSVKIAVRDTVRERDTLYIYLEREQVTWEDEHCKVYASGIQPQVDSVRHYLTTTTINTATTQAVEKVKKTRWGLGVQVGYGVSTQGLTPYVGVGLSWNFLTF